MRLIYQHISLPQLPCLRRHALDRHSIPQAAVHHKAVADNTSVVAGTVQARRIVVVRHTNLVDMAPGIRTGGQVVQGCRSSLVLLEGRRTRCMRVVVRKGSPVVGRRVRSAQGCQLRARWQTGSQ